MNRIKLFLKRSCGATAIEYGMIAALIAVAIVGGVTVVGTEVGASFSNLGDQFN